MPAAALRGLTKVFSAGFALAARSARSKASRRMKTSPRTSSTAASLPFRRSGIARDGADVVRHVLAGLAVAARGGLHQHAVLVAQVDREAVELELGRVVDRRRVVAPARARAARARRTRARRASVVSVSVRIDSIGTACRTGVEAFEHRADHALRRRVGRHAARDAPPRSPAAPGTAGRTRRRESRARRARSSGSRVVLQFGAARRGRRGSQAWRGSACFEGRTPLS